ncbi:APA family basic amino acid/polyamine antiporter [Flavobacterium sp. 7E]|uniref:APC family permease n=1 Tax=unclassified Flavobacterium TaxID=196869 RepID=UPI00156FF933|nr:MULTISPECIES: amino acid permease [unclassified Flavobacterium]MBE0390472.1 Serine/threonine exchanger SteT [Flavobacterium sp. PL002]NRS88261.1 APA family basic amino acid/polyamine antiporter [Flavobacterium sp. 7E]
MSENKTELKRSLGLIDATSLVAGSMIGSGIFIVTSAMARDIGSAAWLLVIWLVTGLITVAAALSYGELAGMMPNAGGQFVYIQRAYGRLVSFLYGWTVFTVVQTGVIAAIAVTFANYSAIFFPTLDDVIFTIGTNFSFTNSKVLAVFSIILLTYINTKGVRSGKIVQLILTSAKLIALFALIILGLYVGLQTNILSDNFTNMWEASKTVVEPNGTITVTKLTGMALLGAAAATMINSLFSSDAWNNVTFIAGEIKEPKKNIPRSLFLGTLIVTIIYVLANVAYLALLPMQGTPGAATAFDSGIMFASNDRVGAAAAGMIMGNVSVFVMAALIMVSTFGANSGLILSGGRLFFAMAKDGLFFKQATELNKNQVPAKALWVQCIWACVLAVSGKFGDLLTYATFANLLFYILTILGVFILRKKEPNTERPYKAFGYPFVPALYVLVTTGICLTLLVYDTVNTGLGLGIVLLGIPVYYFLMNKK